MPRQIKFKNIVIFIIKPAFSDMGISVPEFSNNICFKTLGRQVLIKLLGNSHVIIAKQEIPEQMCLKQRKEMLL